MFLTHSFYPFLGGIETVSEILASAFYDAGHEVHLLTWQEDHSNKPFPYQVIRKPKFLTLVKEHAWADVVFENNPCLQLAWPSVIFRKPSVVALHTWVSRIDGSLNYKDRLKLGWWLRRASKVVAVSHALSRKCWPEAIVVGNPFQADRFRVMPEMKKNGDFIFLGRLVSDKGVDLAIQAIDKLRTADFYNCSNDQSLHLTIVGDGPERKNLEKMVQDLGLEAYIGFKGAMSGDELVACLNQHKYLLIPSKWEEPFGLVALEGMACGCIPIASDCGGLTDAVGKAGVTFQAGNVDALCEAICRVIKQPALERQLLHAGSEHLKAFYPASISNKYLTILEEAVNC